MLELAWQCGILLFFMDVGTVLTVWYFVIFLLELSWQCVMLFFYWILELSWLWYFVVFHGCWNCSESVVFCCFSIGTVLTVWYFVIFLLELSWQCGIMLFFYWNCPDSVVLCYFSIGTVLRMWYFVVFHRCWNWPDSVVFCCFSWMLELSWHCGILLFFY
jgi:hypothetical protein